MSQVVESRGPDPAKKPDQTWLEKIAPWIVGGGLAVGTGYVAYKYGQFRDVSNARRIIRLAGLAPKPTNALDPGFYRNAMQQQANDLEMLGLEFE